MYFRRYCQTINGCCDDKNHYKVKFVDLAGNCALQVEKRVFRVITTLNAVWHNFETPRMI